ncbi:hypothetical protein [Paenibacillus sp. GCM10023250]|uniref:hypothetical protein n=1 Tax=Paenibacillus sp. GCM10023250 TaxID=3252648 RepID=UPI0036073130
MVEAAAYLTVWLIGLFGIVILVCAYMAKVVIDDTMDYDERYIWMRKLPSEASGKR